MIKGVSMTKPGRTGQEVIQFKSPILLRKLGTNMRMPQVNIECVKYLFLPNFYSYISIGKCLATIVNKSLWETYVMQQIICFTSED